MRLFKNAYAKILGITDITERISMIKNNQSGFTPILVLVAVFVLGGVGFGVWRVAEGNKSQVNNQAETPTVNKLSAEDKATLAQANELKKIDFDLDGRVNSIDQDDDSDDQIDDVDLDDDNDGQSDDVDLDDDNDGVDTEKDDEAKQQLEVDEGNRGRHQEGSSSDNDSHSSN